MASGEGSISKYEEPFFKAAARAQKDTGIVIITHTEAGTMGPEQADLLLSEGGIKEKIAIGHMCGNKDINYHLEVLKRGVYDAFDRCGEENFFGSPSDDERIQLIMKLMEKGYGNRILMAHDSVNALLGRKLVFPPEFEVENQIVMTRMFEIINPKMRSHGMSQKDIDQIQIDNIAKLFS